MCLDDCVGCRPGLTIRDLRSFTIWCRAFGVFFTRRDIPANLFDVSQSQMMPHILSISCFSMVCCIVCLQQPGVDVFTQPLCENCEPLNDELQVSWVVDQLQDMICIQLCGCIDEGDYMAFGISGSGSSVEMVGADTVVTWHDSEGTGAVDYYLSARAQVSNQCGVMHACSQAKLGMTIDLKCMYL